MAQNLRAKMSPSDTLIVHDINQSSMQKFLDEVKAAGFGAGSVETTDSARTVAEKSVRMADSLSVHVVSFVKLTVHWPGNDNYQPPRTAACQASFSQYLEAGSAAASGTRTVIHRHVNHRPRVVQRDRQCSPIAEPRAFRRRAHVWRRGWCAGRDFVVHVRRLIQD